MGLARVRRAIFLVGLTRIRFEIHFEFQTRIPLPRSFRRKRSKRPDRLWTAQAGGQGHAARLIFLV